MPITIKPTPPSANSANILRCRSVMWPARSVQPLPVAERTNRFRRIRFRIWTGSNKMLIMFSSHRMRGPDRVFIDGFRT